MSRQKKIVVNRVVAVRLPEELRSKLQAFADSSSSYNSVGEVAKVLMARGLFLEEKPSGSLSEAAFEAAYVTAKGALLDTALRKVNSMLQTAMDSAYAEIQSKQGRSAL